MNMIAESKIRRRIKNSEMASKIREACGAPSDIPLETEGDI
jgi:hypothetical protein